MINRNRNRNRNKKAAGEPAVFVVKNKVNGKKRCNIVARIFGSEKRG